MRFNPRAVHVYTSLFIIRWRNNSKAVDDRDVLVYIIFPRSRGRGTDGATEVYYCRGKRFVFFIPTERTNIPSIKSDT